MRSRRNVRLALGIFSRTHPKMDRTEVYDFRLGWASLHVLSVVLKSHHSKRALQTFGFLLERKNSFLFFTSTWKPAES